MLVARLMLHPMQSGGHSLSCLKPQQSKLYSPVEYIELQSPTNLEEEVPIAIEPCMDTKGIVWIEPSLSKSIDGVVHIPNLSPHPAAVHKHEHLAQVHYTSADYEIEMSSVTSPCTMILNKKGLQFTQLMLK